MRRTAPRQDQAGPEQTLPSGRKASGWHELFLTRCKAWIRRCDGILRRSDVADLAFHARALLFL